MRSRQGTLAEADEERLVRLVAKGDRAAFEELYRRTSPWMAVRLRRRCSDEQIVAEVMQESYLAVWRAAGAFGGSAVGGSALGWLWTIASRKRAPHAAGIRTAGAGGRAAGRGPVLRGRPAGRTGGEGGPVRWVTLYARSRQVPASLALVLIGAGRCGRSRRARARGRGIRGRPHWC
ncbi:RNA polymerase sigma factor [Streptomyces sp. V4I2]|uniref:RNA polymerase sigma factor n=1 Tax=Streptomyces sp. V4I2 TaxID=3042280 RepID=UPI0027D80C80|nr:RNA polymerase subunit sigma-24 [Streptomyces sp. V4I2]